MGAPASSAASRFNRPVAVVAAGSLALASFVTALLAHGLIALAGSEAGGGTYAERAHAAVGPVLMMAAVLVAAGLMRVACDALTRLGSGDPVGLIAARLTAARPGPAVVVVAAGGFAALLGMEFAEQLAAVGRIEGIADALGGTPPAGLACVLGAALITVFAGRSLAGCLIAATTRAALGIVRLLRAGGAVVRALAGVRRRDVRRAPPALAPAFLARSRGLRAPPAIG